MQTNKEQPNKFKSTKYGKIIEELFAGKIKKKLISSKALTN